MLLIFSRLNFDSKILCIICWINTKANGANAYLFVINEEQRLFIIDFIFFSYRLQRIAAAVRKTGIIENFKFLVKIVEIELQYSPAVCCAIIRRMRERFRFMPTWKNLKAENILSIYGAYARDQCVLRPCSKLWATTTKRN